MQPALMAASEMQCDRSEPALMAAFEMECDRSDDIVSFLLFSFFKILPSILFCLGLYALRQVVAWVGQEEKDISEIPIDTSGGNEKEYAKLNHKYIEQETVPN